MSPPRARLLRPGGLVVLVAALGWLLETDCSLLSDRAEVELLLPALPEAWLPCTARGEELTYRVSIAAGASREETVTAAGLRTLAVRLPKEVNLPVLAYPMIGAHPAALKPAGALFPLHLDARGRLALTWANGFLAESLAMLGGCGELRAALNARRLEQELIERSGGDPWTLDRERLLATLPYGSMDADHIRQLPAHTLAIHASGRWAPGDPLRALLEAGPGGLLVIEGIREGMSCYVRADGAAGTAPGEPELLEIFADRAGWSCRDAATGFSESGRW